MENENTPAIRFVDETQPEQVHAREGRIAGLCKEIVTATAQNIKGKKYVKVEGWQAIATTHGCVASARDVKKVDGGFTAIGEIRRMDTGTVISTAEGFCGDDESTWKARPEYAKRAMAQTRAISRACRSAFAHIVVMMQAGLETTPAEEIPDEHISEKTEKKEHTKSERAELCSELLRLAMEKQLSEKQHEFVAKINQHSDSALKKAIEGMKKLPDKTSKPDSGFTDDPKFDESEVV